MTQEFKVRSHTIHVRHPLALRYAQSGCWKDRGRWANESVEGQIQSEGLPQLSVLIPGGHWGVSGVGYDVGILGIFCTIYRRLTAVLRRLLDTQLRSNLSMSAAERFLVGAKAVTRVEDQQLMRGGSV